jgi:hypothetical protein
MEEWNRRRFISRAVIAAGDHAGTAPRAGAQAAAGGFHLMTAARLAGSLAAIVAAGVAAAGGQETKPAELRTLTYFNRTDLDEAAGPFRMQVREHPRGGPERQREERVGAFAAAREFFSRHLR